MPNLPEGFEDYVRRTLAPHVELAEDMSVDQMLNAARTKMLEIKEALYSIYKLYEKR
ncbi:MAG: hypothetical protein LJE65_01030 [Desulfobacteraceae bacterium]|nr:hypothetical protein [Desulfobacteraceae bacterium]